MAEFSENRHISNLINMSCKVCNSIDARQTGCSRFEMFHGVALWQCGFLIVVK